jgi:sulfur carrier protein ThiS adenylyltransferase
MNIHKIDKKINPGDPEKIFSSCKIIVEGLDDKIMKKNLIEELSGKNKIIVSASGIAGENMNKIRTKKLGNCYVVGDLISDENDFPLFPPKIAMIASVMAGIVLKIAG